MEPKNLKLPGRMLSRLPEGCSVRFEYHRYSDEDVSVALERLETEGWAAYLEAVSDVQSRPLRTYDEKRAATLSPSGGTTIATILDSEGNEVAQGVAQCSLRDVFSRRLGRMISLGKAIKEMEAVAA